MIDLSSMASGYEMNEMRCVLFSSHASAPRRKATLYNHHTSNITLEMTSFSKLFILLILFNSLKSKQWKLNVYKLQSIAETTEKIIQRCQEFPLVDRFSFWPILVRHHTFVAELPIDEKKLCLLHIYFDFLTQVLKFLQICRGFCRCKNQKSQLWPLFQRDILPSSFKLIFFACSFKRLKVHKSLHAVQRAWQDMQFTVLWDC